MNTRAPLVSVIIPTYNHAEFIADAVESALRQTHPAVEVIVVDDGSRDDTPAVMRRYGDTVRYIRKMHTRTSDTLNVGIMKSTGKYISWLSSDDRYLPERIAKAVALLEGNPEIGFVYGGFEQIDEKGGIVGSFPARRHADDALFPELTRRCFINGNTVTFEKALLETTGLFDARLHFLQDYDMWLRMSRVTRFGCVAEPLSQTRIHGRNQFHDKETYRREYPLFWENYRDRYPIALWMRKGMRGLQDAYLARARVFRARGELEEAVKDFRLALTGGAEVPEALLALAQIADERGEDVRAGQYYARLHQAVRTREDLACLHPRLSLEEMRRLVHRDIPDGERRGMSALMQKFSGEFKAARMLLASPVRAARFAQAMRTIRAIWPEAEVSCLLPGGAHDVRRVVPKDVAVLALEGDRFDPAGLRGSFVAKIRERRFDMALYMIMGDDFEKYSNVHAVVERFGAPCLLGLDAHDRFTVFQ